MRCPACQTENNPARDACVRCQASLSAPVPPPTPSPAPARRRPRRRPDPSCDAPLSAEAEAFNRAALRAYRMGLLAMVPFVGLVLGPASALVGMRLGRRAWAVEGFNGQGPLRVAVGLGLAVTLTQWLGLGLILLGLWS